MPTLGRKHVGIFTVVAGGLAVFFALTAGAVLTAADVQGSLAQEQFETANEFFESYDFENAEQAYLQALDMNPTVQWAHHQLGRIYFSGNELKRALGEFNQEIALHKDSASSFYMRGLTYAFLEELKLAEQDFRSFLGFYPNSEAGLNDLAYVMFLQNRFEDAEEILQELSEKRPSSFLANQGLAAVYIELDRFEEAEGFVTKALAYAEGMDIAMFQQYYPSLKPEHAAKGLETIQRGIRHNFNIVSSLQEGEFKLDEDTPAILRPYFKSASKGKYGAVFLAASCAAGFQHTSECQSSSTITSPSSGSWFNSSFSISVSDSVPAGAELTTCWQTSPDLGVRTCNGSDTVSAGSGGSCSTQGSNTCSVTVDAGSQQAGGGTSFGFGGASTRSFSIDYTSPTGSVSASPTSVFTGDTITIPTTGADSHSGVDWLNFTKTGEFWSCGGASSCNHSFTTSESTAGDYTYTIFVFDGSNNTTGFTSNTVTVSNPPAQISVTPSSKNYETFGVDDGLTVGFTVSNAGGSTLSGSVSGLAAPFSCTSNCTNYSVGAGSSINVNLRFAPTSAGNFSDIANFSGAGGDSVSLSGVGVDWVAGLNAAPCATCLNGTVVTITGTSNAAVNTSPYWIRIYEGSNVWPSFLVSCASGTTCLVNVGGFTDTTKTYTTRIENSTGSVIKSSSGPWAITWQPNAQIAVTPTSLSFGTIGIGSWQNQDFTVSNSGGLTVTGIVSGLAAPFSCFSGCGTYNLSGAATQNVTIRFLPTTAIFSSGTAEFSGEGGPLNRTVSGTGDDWIAGISDDAGGPVANGTSVTLTATSNFNIGFSPYFIRIYDGSTQLKTCGSGTECTLDVSNSDTAISYTAKIENSAATIIKSISAGTLVTWQGPPDLIVQSIIPTPPSPLPGEDISYAVVVKNQGALESSGGWITGYNSDPPLCGSADWFAAQTLGTIAGGATKPFVLVKSGGFATGGSKTIWMYVDDLCNVTESNGTNNELFDTLTVNDSTSVECVYGNCIFSKTLLVPGENVSVGGRLLDGNAGGLAGKPLELRKSDGTWATWLGADEAGSQTDATGTRLYVWTPSCSTYLGTNSFYVRFKGDTSYQASQTADNALNIAVPALTYPSTSWQRLWYSVSGVSPTFTDCNYLGTSSESSGRFDTNWGAGVPFSGGPSDLVGFKSSRSFTVGTTGVYEFMIGSDDGARLTVGGVTIADQWGDGSYRTTTGSINLGVGSFNYLFEYYDNTGNARVMFTPKLRLVVEPTSIVEGETLTLKAYCAGACEGRTVFFWNTFNLPGSFGSCVISSGYCQIGFTTGIGFGGGVVDFWARIDLSSPLNGTDDDGEQSDIVGVSVSTCQKTSSPKEDTFNVSIITAGAPKTCPLLITHKGINVTGGGSLSYERTSSTPQIPRGGGVAFSSSIEMDEDAPGAGDCGPALKWWTDWEDPSPTQWNFWTTSSFVSQDSTEDMRWGYDLLIPPSERYCRFVEADSILGLSAVGEDQYIDTHPVLSSDVFYSVDALYSDSAANGRVEGLWGTNHNLVECITDAHCTPGSGSANTDAVSTTQTCNLGQTANFPLNTCIDSVAPSEAKIMSISSPDSGQAIGYRDGSIAPLGSCTAGQICAFIRAKDDGTNRIYSVSVKYKDAGGLSLCRLRITDQIFGTQEQEVACSGTITTKIFTFTVGPTGDCRTEENNNCTLEAYAVDAAANEEVAIRIAPSDEQSYIDFPDTHDDINYFQFGVDYTPPQ